MTRQPCTRCVQGRGGSQRFFAPSLFFTRTTPRLQGKEAIAAFFDTLFSLLPVGSTQIKRFEHKVHDNTVLLWWAADSSEATFEMHAVFVVNKGSIVTHSMGGVRKIKNRADRTSK